MYNKPEKRPSDVNQQVATSVRPQLPRDGSKGMTKWEPGQLPRGGYRSTFCFEEGSYSNKQSPTSGGGKKVY
jgi:hypothetical protein